MIIVILSENSLHRKDVLQSVKEKTSKWNTERDMYGMNSKKKSTNCNQKKNR